MAADRPTTFVTISPRQKKYHDILVEVAKERCYQVLGIYVSNDTKIQMQCPNNHIFDIIPSSFKSGSGCAKCSGKCPIQAKDDFYLMATERHYHILGNYINTRTKVRMQCPNNHICDIAPCHFKNGKGCIKCAGKCPVDARNSLYSAAEGRKYKILGSYINDCTKIQMQCHQNHIFEITPNAFKDGQGCAKCAGQCPIQIKKDFYLVASERSYQILGSYINTLVKIEMQCPNNHIFEMTPNAFKNGQGCAKCAGKCPIQARENFYSAAKERGYQILGTYIKTLVKVEMQCPNNHIFEITPNDFKSGYGCSVCSESCGEQLIRDSLNHLKIIHASQYTLSTLPNRRYDFLIFSETQEKIFVEWDGEQHFRFIEYFHKDEYKFMEGQEIDILKSQKVIDDGSKMIRIDYTWLNKSKEEIAEFIESAMSRPEKLIVSNSVMYRWLTSKVVVSNQRKIKLVIRSLNSLQIN
jgi:flavoprotein